MQKRGSEDSRCKAFNSETSRSKGLGFVSSPTAATLAAGFFLVTCYVVFKDVADGAPITPDHVMSFAVLVGTFASGHLLSEQLRQWRLVPAVGLLILFSAGTFYCVTASGGRNAATSGAKAELVHKDNDDRARVETDLKVAKERLATALEAEEAECGSGKGPKCEGRKATREERQTYVNVLDAQLRMMDPAKSEYPELRHAAKLFASIVSASEQSIFDRLVLWFPFVKAIFAEIATLVFGAIGFRHRSVDGMPGQSSSASGSFKHSGATVSPPGKPRETVLQKPRETVAQRKPKPTLGFLPRKSSGKPFSKDEALADLLAYVARNGSLPSQATLKDRYGVGSKGTISKWLGEWEDNGHIKRSQIGRRKSISL